MVDLVQSTAAVLDHSVVVLDQVDLVLVEEVLVSFFFNLEGFQRKKLKIFLI